MIRPGVDYKYMSLILKGEYLDDTNTVGFLGLNKPRMDAVLRQLA